MNRDEALAMGGRRSIEEVPADAGPAHPVADFDGAAHIRRLSGDTTTAAGRSPQASPPYDGDSMETLIEAIERLRAEGYTADFSATEDGRLLCRSCDVTEDPANMQIDDTVRFEGTSNPDDEAILVAISCAAGCRGLYSSAYGPSTPPDDVAVLQRLPNDRG